MGLFFVSCSQDKSVDDAGFASTNQNPQVVDAVGAAERVFVTEDSMTMLSEAACALRPVHSLRPATAAPAQRYEQALQRFAGQRWLCRHTIAELADRVEALDAQHCQALAASPTQRLADQLRERLQSPPKPTELILATTTTIEGEATAHYLGEMAHAHGIRATRIAHGVPMGGELEYIDGNTLSHAFAGRRDV